MNSSAFEPLYSVSVVIPAFNAEKHINRAIESVLSQTRGADEIIVVDDGSTDGTAELVRPHSAKVRYIRQETGGVSSARNRGIKAARSEWIGFLDAKDELLPEKLKVQMAHLRRNKDLVWAFADYYQHSGGENRPRPARDVSKVEAFLAGKEYFECYFSAFLAGFYAWTGTLLIKRRTLIEAGLFRKGHQQTIDLDMWFRIAYRQPEIGYINQPLAINYVESSKVITKKQEQLEEFSDLIARHLKLSAQQGRLEQFRPCAVRILKSTIRERVMDRRGSETIPVLKRFEELLERRFRREMRLRMKWPRLGPFFLGISSAIHKICRSRRK